MIHFNLVTVISQWAKIRKKSENMWSKDFYFAKMPLRSFYLIFYCTIFPFLPYYYRTVLYIETSSSNGRYFDPGPILSIDTVALAANLILHLCVAI